jgi:cytoskeletal protein CcmA (bactofilin family)
VGFIGKSGKGKSQHGGTTIVAAGSKFRGELILESALHIDGVVDGTIESSGDVSIGGSGSFEGTLSAHHVVISGYLHGKVDCERLEIVASGKVFGEVNSQEFVIEPGGQFIGESRIRHEGPVPALRHQTEGEHVDDEASPATRLQEA